MGSTTNSLTKSLTIRASPSLKSVSTTDTKKSSFSSLLDCARVAPCDYADYRKLLILQGTDVHARSAAQGQLIMGLCKTDRWLHLSTINCLSKSFTIRVFIIIDIVAIHLISKLLY